MKVKSYIIAPQWDFDWDLEIMLYNLSINWEGFFKATLRKRFGWINKILVSSTTEFTFYAESKMFDWSNKLFGWFNQIV